MAMNRWQPATTVYDTAGNWLLAAKPIANERTLIPEDASYGIVTGQDNENTIDCDEIYVAKGFAHPIGTSAAPWYISTDLLKFFGAGSFYYKVGDADTDRVEIRAAHEKTYVHLDNKAGQKIVLAQFTRGNIIVAGTITTAMIGFVNKRNTDCTVAFDSGAGTVTFLMQYAGNVKADNVVTTLDIGGGTLERGGTAAMGTAYIRDRGTLYYDGTGTLTAAHVFAGGILDLNRTLAEKTVTTCYLYPYGTLLHDDTIHTVNIVYVKEAA